MHGHLVTVKVSVKGRADQWVQLDRFTLNQDGFKRLNAKTVQRRRTVQHDRVFADHLIEDIPHLGAFFFHQFLGLLHRGRQAFGFKT